jgi:hypothetical protein
MYCAPTIGISARKYQVLPDSGQTSINVLLLCEVTPNESLSRKFTGDCFSKRRFAMTKIIKQKNSRPTGAREVSRGSTQIVTPCREHLFGPVTGSADRLSGRVHLALGLTLTGGFRWLVSKGGFQPVVSYLWWAFPATRPGRGGMKIGGIILRFLRISRWMGCPSKLISNDKPPAYPQTPFSKLRSRVKLKAIQLIPALSLEGVFLCRNN